MRRMRRLSALVATGVVVASLFATAGTASAAPGDATLWVVHGVPGATVEVCVNGAPAKEDFAYRQKFSTLVPAGDYTFALYANGANCTGTPIDQADITRTVAMDGNYTIVAGVSNRPARFGSTGSRTTWPTPSAGSSGCRSVTSRSPRP